MRPAPPGPSGPATLIGGLALVGALLLGTAGCSSSDDAPRASSASTAVPTTAPAATPSTDPTGTRTASPASTGSPVRGGSDSKAVCTRVVKIVQDAGRQAIAALTPALQTGDQAKLNAAQTKAQGYYRQAAADLRAEADTAADAALAADIRAAAAHYDQASRSASLSGDDKALSKLTERCA
ncbi:hypothetical protein [Cryptosporangium minutisporangium]